MVSEIEAKWLIAYVASQQEARFCDWLMERSVECYFPLARRTARPKHVKSAREIGTPAFPHYVFVHVRYAAQRIMLPKAPGFWYMLQVSGFPLTLGGQQIDALRAMEERGDFNSLRDGTELAFSVGQKVLITKGHLEGYTGIVRRKTEKRFALADLEVGGRRVLLPVAFLRLLNDSPCP